MLAWDKKGVKNGSGFYEYGAKINFCLAPNKSCARISWDGNLLTIDILKKLKEAFSRAVLLGAESVILEINSKYGADIKEFLPALFDKRKAKYLANAWHLLVSEIMRFPGPVISVIRKSAIGGAYELALASDYIIAEYDAKIGLPEMKLGLLPASKNQYR
jgi:enoyl-CoA hydratase/carnithine racemase